jgi:hypothetical protein
VVLVLVGMLVVEHRLVPVPSDIRGKVHSETVT